MLQPCVVNFVNLATTGLYKSCEPSSMVQTVMFGQTVQTQLVGGLLGYLLRVVRKDFFAAVRCFCCFKMIVFVS